MMIFCHYSARPLSAGRATSTSLPVRSLKHLSASDGRRRRAVSAASRQRGEAERQTIDAILRRRRRSCSGCCGWAV